jgi:hypothetical protein
VSDVSRDEHLRVVYSAAAEAAISLTNPFSRADCEATGVAPDVKTPAADALEAAERLAQAKLEKK